MTTLANSMCADLGFEALATQTTLAIMELDDMRQILEYGQALLAAAAGQEAAPAPAPAPAPSPRPQPAPPAAAAAPETEGHWPSLPAGPPPPARPPPRAPPPLSSVAPQQQQPLPPPPRAAPPLLDDAPAAAADSLAADDNAPSGSSVALSGIRATLGVGWGDDAVLWPHLMASVSDLVASSPLPAEGEGLQEVLALCLACCTAFPANSGTQIHRLVMAMAVICCPPDIARINHGRSSCVHKFLGERAAWWAVVVGVRGDGASCSSVAIECLGGGTRDAGVCVCVGAGGIAHACAVGAASWAVEPSARQGRGQRCACLGGDGALAGACRNTTRTVCATCAARAARSQDDGLLQQAAD